MFQSLPPSLCNTPSYIRFVIVQFVRQYFGVVPVFVANEIHKLVIGYQCVVALFADGRENLVGQ